MKLVVAFILLSSTIYSQNLSDGLVLYYSFDNGQAIDESGNGLDGTLMGPVPASDRNSIADKALAFDPMQTIEIANSPSLQIQYPISASLWVLFNTDDFEDWSIIRTDFQKDNYSGWYLNRFGDGKLSFANGGNLGFAGAGNARSIVSEEAFEITRVWTHIAVVMVGPSRGELYLDGCEVAVTTGGSGPSAIAYTGNSTFIGRNNNNGSLQNPNEPDRFFDGIMDELYVWNRLITNEEIQFLYDNFHTPSIAIPDQAGCENLDLSVSDSLTSVAWSNGDLGNATTISEPGTYSVFGVYDCYIVQDTFEVTGEAPAINLTAMIDTCEGLAAISYQGVFDQALWSTEETTPSITVTDNGSYSVTVTNSCGTASADISVEGLENSTPTISGTEAYVFTGFDTVFVADIQTDGESITWSPVTGLSCSDCPNPIITALDDITYNVTASNEAGCTTAFEISIRQDQSLSPLLSLANIINPNSMNPGNRRFYFPARVVGEYTLQIFDRWGNTVYSATALTAGDPSQGWDGTWGGDQASNGAYAYLITFVLNDQLQRMTGSVTLLR